MDDDEYLLTCLGLEFFKKDFLFKNRMDCVIYIDLGQVRKAGYNDVLSRFELDHKRPKAARAVCDRLKISSTKQLVNGNISH